MAIPGTLSRWVFSGDLANGEHFAHGFYVSGNNGFTDNITAGSAWLVSFLSSPMTVIGGTGTMAKAFMPSTVWKGLHVANIDPLTGAQTGPGMSTSFTQPGVGTGSSFPNQVTHCVTLIAGNQPGLRRRRNRFYLPPYVVGLVSDAGGRLSSGYVTMLAAAVKAGMAGAVSAVPGFAYAVYSKADKEAFLVTESYIGDYQDTQRRRRRSVIENRTTSALP